MADRQSNAARKLKMAVSMPELPRPAANENEGGGSPQKRVCKDDDGQDRQRLAALEKAKSNIEIGARPVPSSGIEPFGRGATFE